MSDLAARSRALALAAVLPLAVTTGCGGSIATCVPGVSSACACAGTSVSGAQTCAADGTFGRCDCGGAELRSARATAAAEVEPGAPAPTREPAREQRATVISGGDRDGCVPDPVADAARRANEAVPSMHTDPATAWVTLQDLEYVDDHRSGPEICVTFAEWGGSEEVTYWTYGPVGGSCLRFLGEVQDRRGDRDVPSL